MCINKKHMKSIVYLFLLFFISCATSKSYKWDGKSMSEKKYNKKLINYTRNFVKKSQYEISDFNVKYDTLKTR